MTGTGNQSQHLGNKRVQWIDTAKGVAIILVLIVHSSFWDFSTSHDNIKFIPFIRKCLVVTIASYMPLFYFLSGYTYKPGTYVLKLRFDRLIKPYLQWGTLCILISWLIADEGILRSGQYISPVLGLLYSRYSLFPAESTNNILLLSENAQPLWFLTSLFTSFICFLPLIHFRKYQKHIIIAYLFITLALSFSPILLPWSIDTAPLGALFLFAGFTCKERKLFFYLNKWLLFGAIPLLAIYVVAVWYNGGINMSIRGYGEHPFLSPFLCTFIGISGSTLFCIVCMLIEKLHLCAPLAYLGRISLTILCCHSIVYQLLNKLIPKGNNFFTPLLDHSQAFFAIQVFAALLVSILICEIPKRLRLHKSN